MTLVGREGLQREQVDRDRVATEGVENDHVVLLIGFAFHAEAGVAHDEFRLGLRIFQVGERRAREAGHVIVNLVEAERVAGASPGSEGAGTEADGTDAAAAFGLEGAQKSPDAAGRGVVTAGVGAFLGVDVLESVDRGAVLQCEMMQLGIAGVVLDDLEHAVEAAGHADGAAQGGRSDVIEAVAEGW